MKVFITGASGVIGQRVVPTLLAQGHSVTAGGRASPRLDVLRTSRATVIALDIFDSVAAERAMVGHDVAINLATKVPSANKMIMPSAWSEMSRIRSHASRSLTEAASRAGVSRFIQESFAPIYADAGDRWISESAPVKPVKYNKAVLDAEESAHLFAKRGGTAVILRFALFYGPDDPFTGTMLSAIRRGWMPILGKRESYVSMVAQHDAANAVVAALGVPSGTYNVVDDEPMTRQAFGSTLAAQLGVKPPKFLPSWITKLGGSMGDAISRSLRISNGALKRVSNWTPEYPSTREGFRAVLESDASSTVSIRIGSS
jgi:nucleoside-diphosphate-sugar epimerase